MMILDSVVIILAYLVGSFSTAIIYAKMSGIPDPRGQGSGNPGATNVLRVGGKKAAIITLAGDIFKGWLPVFTAIQFDLPVSIVAGVGLAAFLGHLYPVYFQFKGGKGVATSLGVLLGIAWPIGVALVITWLLVAVISRLSSLAALCAAMIAPLYVWLLVEPSIVYLWLSVIMTILLLFRHRSNIKKLLAGTEPRIGGTKSTLL